MMDDLLEFAMYISDEVGEGLVFWLRLRMECLEFRFVPSHSGSALGERVLTWLPQLVLIHVPNHGLFLE